ncbi:DUF362 domain-containing protein [Candidatus Omnitrophota bacterium]
MNRAKVSIVKCNDYQRRLVQSSVVRAIDLIGGISSFIRPQSRVLVKPNLLMAKGPDSGITTHPEVVRAVVRMLKGIDCQVIVGDGPSVWGNQIENVDEVYEFTGIKQVCLDEGVSLVKFDKRRWHKKFPLSTWLDHCDHVVNLPKFKTHDLTTLTGAIKNLFGVVTGSFKTELHKNYYKIEDFSGILVDIYEAVKPSLTLVDAVVAMEGDGPASAGKLRKPRLLLAGSDCVALDSILALIMGIRPTDIVSTKEAASRGLGVADLDSISVAGEKLEDAIGEPFLLPSTSMIKKIPGPVIELAKKLIKFRPYVLRENCTKCRACIDACPNKCIQMKNELITFDYKNCISCFCCQEACPTAAIQVKKSIIAKIIGL